MKMTTSNTLSGLPVTVSRDNGYTQTPLSFTVRRPACLYFFTLQETENRDYLANKMHWQHPSILDDIDDTNPDLFK